MTDARRELAKSGDSPAVRGTGGDGAGGGGKAVHGSRKRVHTPPPAVNPQAGVCSYYLTGKQRFCRTECRPGSRFCATHSLTPVASLAASAPPGAETEGDVTATPDFGTRHGRTRSLQRVPCPLNPNHSVYADRLNKHLRVCPDLRFVTATLPYYAKNRHANKGRFMCGVDSDTPCVSAYEAQMTLPASSGITQSKCLASLCKEPAEHEPAGSASTLCKTRRQTHHDLTPSHLQSLITRVETCYARHIAPQLVHLDPAAVARVARLTQGDDGCATAAGPCESSGRAQRSQKHGPQHDALLCCLDEAICSAVACSTAARTQPVLPSPSAASAADMLRGVQPVALRVHAFLELGAGKGGLAVALQRLLRRYMLVDEDSRAAMREQLPFLAYVVPQPRLVVVDCDGFRRKGDACVSRSALPLQRLRIDIKDLHLARALADSLAPCSTAQTDRIAIAKQPQCVQGGGGDAGQDKRYAAVAPPMLARRAVAVLGKHLCGACTDFSLSCLTEPELETGVMAGPGQCAGGAKATDVGTSICACVLATCCHHRCELRHLNPLRSVAAGVCLDAPDAAVCTRAGHEEQRQDGTSDAYTVRLPGTDFALTACEFAALTSMSSWAVSGAIVEAARRTTGRCCKRVIDALRVAYLRQNGFTAHLCEYTSTDVTEENVCIVAWKAKMSVTGEGAVKR